MNARPEVNVDETAVTVSSSLNLNEVAVKKKIMMKQLGVRVVVPVAVQGMNYDVLLEKQVSLEYFTGTQGVREPTGLSAFECFSKLFSLEIYDLVAYQINACGTLS